MDIMCEQIPFPTENQFKKPIYIISWLPLITKSDLFGILALP